MLALALAFSLPLAGLAFTFAGRLMRAIDVPAEAWPDAVSYLLISSAGMVFVFGYNAAAGVLRGLGDSRHPLEVVALAAGVNIGLDLVLVGPMGLGVAGAAYAQGECAKRIDSTCVG